MAQTIKQKCDAIGISLPTYYLRLKNGMTPEEALSTPNKRRTSKLKPTPKPVPAPMPETEDQEPRAPLMMWIAIQFISMSSCKPPKTSQDIEAMLCVSFRIYFSVRSASTA